MNSNINFNYDLDYSKDRDIDKRVLEICAIAEAKYLEGLKNIKSNNFLSKNIDVNELIINDNKSNKRSNINELKNTLKTNISDIQNKSYFTCSKLAKIENKSIDFEKNILSQKFYNNYIGIKPFIQRMQNINSFSISKIPKTKKNKHNYDHLQSNEDNNNFKSNLNNNYFLNNLNKTQKFYTPKHINKIFSNDINKNYILRHNIHIKNKNKIELNKILLQSQTFIKNHKYISAYYLLRNIILTGEYHSDLFYLYGEVNRILENYQIAEDFLLLALNFEIHSPFVFYSIGLLYKDLNKYDYSNIFFRLFQRLINNDCVHFYISKNYMLMGELLKAAKEITIAIEKNKEKDIYYKLRSEIYKKLGMYEMSNDDLNMYNFIKSKKTDEKK